MARKRVCGNCGASLQGYMSSARFCGAKCRVAAHRGNRLALADDLLELVAPPPVIPGSPEEIAASLNGSPERSWQETVARVERGAPELVAAFGQPVLTAAARPAAAGVCRFCLALSDAAVHRLPEPRLDAATLRVLGTPCTRCLTRIRAGLAARVEQGRPRTAVLTASAAEFRGMLAARKKLTPTETAAIKRNLHAHYCRICHAARTAARALVASGQPGVDSAMSELIQAAVRPHQPKLAPTGELVASASLVHDGNVNGGNPLVAECPCQECRDSRRHRYAQNEWRAARRRPAPDRPRAE